jgi:hypothetical protein
LKRYGSLITRLLLVMTITSNVTTSLIRASITRLTSVFSGYFAHISTFHAFVMVRVAFFTLSATDFACFLNTLFTA